MGSSDAPKKCCLCGGSLKGRFGNNPWPLADVSKRCCDSCDAAKVLPARLAGLKPEAVEA